MKVVRNPFKIKNEYNDFFINIFGGTVGEDEYYIDGKCYTRTEYCRMLKEKENKKSSIHWNYKTLSERKLDKAGLFTKDRFYEYGKEYDDYIKKKSEKLGEKITGNVIAFLLGVVVALLIFKVV